MKQYHNHLDSYQTGIPCLLLAMILLICAVTESNASSIYSRQYKVSCSACHSAPPQLNIFGLRFRQTNSLPNWESFTSVDTGDENTAVPSIFPFSIRSQMLGQIRRGKHYSDISTGEVSHDSNFDLQMPNYIKLISSAPLTENISFYFDAILKPGENEGAISLRESWLRYRIEDGLIASFTAGQFPSSDVIVDQDTRLSLKEYLIYTQSGLGLDQGIRADIDIADLILSLGLSNGLDANPGAEMNTAGIGRQDRIFDNNNRKTIYGYIAKRFDTFKTGVFWQLNQQYGATGSLGDQISDRVIFQTNTGIDIQAFPTPRVSWMFQLMWNKWSEYLEKGKNIQWYGGFLGADYRASDSFAYSLLYNFTSNGDFKNSGTIYEGLSANVVTTTLSYYFRSNVRGLLEITMDFLPQETDANFVGHESKEDAIIIGIDINY
ncbi:MAG: hypothetical protein OEM38_10240 [Gammaproteobacteria bacterium]|nr:hypothetical protein [Gammaproteobacteria bacterium]